VRPNGSTGWVRASDVTTKVLTHDLRIDLSDHRLDLYDKGEKIKSYPIGVGKGDTPTPVGEWFVAIKMKTPNPKQVYGALIMGLSAYSDQLTDWPGGGQVGIHGTNDPATIGTDVSHGCIRLNNDDILEISNDAHLGTPVFVQE
jgi:lipoprotein-anchoring transpeptidase ErfK/SrfK